MAATLKLDLTNWSLDKILKFVVELFGAVLLFDRLGIVHGDLQACQCHRLCDSLSAAPSWRGWFKGGSWSGLLAPTAAAAPIAAAGDSGPTFLLIVVANFNLRTEMKVSEIAPQVGYKYVTSGWFRDAPRP